MKTLKQIIFILVIFLKTETLLSENNLFSVNNIEIEKKDKFTNNALAEKAIQKGFDQLIEKILLREDRAKLSDLSFTSIKQLVTYYQITNLLKEEDNKELVNFSVTFDKEEVLLAEVIDHPRDAARLVGVQRAPQLGRDRGEGRHSGGRAHLVGVRVRVRVTVRVRVRVS